jgi:hypothetical protein
MLGKPAPALRLRHRMTANDFYVGECRAGPDQQRELDRHGDLGLDEQLRAGGQLVKSGVHAALYRTFDRHNCAIGEVGADRVDRRADRWMSHRLVFTGLMQGADCLLAERAARPQVSALEWCAARSRRDTGWPTRRHAVTSLIRSPGHNQAMASTSTTSSTAGVIAVLTTVSSQPSPAGSGMPRAGR